MILNGNFLAAMSSSFWIIPREGSEALIVVIMLLAALRQSGRIDQSSIIYKCSLAAIACGLLLAAGCVFLHNYFTGQSRELSEAFTSLIAMGMLLFVNFDTFSKNDSLYQMRMTTLGFIAFISVFRELAETILFYYGLFQGPIQQQLGTLFGLVLGILLLGLILWAYKTSSSKWRKLNKIIFSLTPWFIFILAIMCIGNTINALQEASWLGFVNEPWMFNINWLHVQSSEQYLLSISIFFASTGFLFIKQFCKSLTLLVKVLFSLVNKVDNSHQVT